MIKFKIIISFLVFSLSGCGANNKKELTEKTQTKQLIELQACMNEAESLLKLNSSHSPEINSFYKLIKDAKYYSSISNKVSDSTRVTITPFYEFRVYDSCNKISQLLMIELKKTGSLSN